MQDPDRLPVLVLHDESIDALFRPFGYLLHHISAATGSPDHATLTRLGPDKPPPLPPPQLREAIEGTLRIVWLRWDTVPDEWRDAHILVVAEEGFSMLNTYTERRRPELCRALWEFAEKMNFEDVPGTLDPAVPMSAQEKQCVSQNDQRGPRGPHGLQLRPMRPKEKGLSDR